MGREVGAWNGLVRRQRLECEEIKTRGPDSYYQRQKNVSVPDYVIAYPCCSNKVLGDMRFEIQLQSKHQELCIYTTAAYVDRYIWIQRPLLAAVAAAGAARETLRTPPTSPRHRINSSHPNAQRRLGRQNRNPCHFQKYRKCQSCVWYNRTPSPPRGNERYSLLTLAP